MRQLASVSTTCLLATLALACASDPGNEDPEDLGLAGRTFLSQVVTEDGDERAVVGSALRLKFHEGSRYSASAGCNSAGGAYQIEEAVFVTSSIATTEIGCNVELHDQDDWYFGVLGMSPSIELDGDSLVLERDGTRIEYLDQEVATPDLELLGTTWTVHTIIEGDVAMGADWPTPATLVFKDEGVEVTTGCNTGSGAYSVVGDTIEFDGVGVTEEACPDELSMSLEPAVLGVVLSADPVTWEIDVATLSLLNAEGSGVVLSGQ